MITPQELRIDNYVWNSTQCIPVLVDVKIIQEQINASKGFGIPWEPITITEEILLKCDFHGLYKSEFNVRLESKQNTAFVFVRKGNNDWYLRYDGEPMIHIKHLHQLQNLYFDLTGQELEIKL